MITLETSLKISVVFYKVLASSPAVSLCTVDAKEACHQTMDENAIFSVSIIKGGVFGIVRPFGIARSPSTGVWSI